MSTVTPIATAPLARKRQAIREQSNRRFLELYDSATEQGRAAIYAFAEAVARLFTARPAREFAKARQDSLAFAANLPGRLDPPRALRWLTLIRPPSCEKNKL